MSISIKISEENYRMLCSLSGRLRETFRKPVSMDEAISFLSKRKKLSELAGSWKCSDKETDEMMKNLRNGWKEWKIKSA